MTEEEWLTVTDPSPMLEFLTGKASDRKLRLFGCGCCRWVWHLMTDDRCRVAVDVAEKFADGLATADDWRDARRRAEAAIIEAKTTIAMDAADAAYEAAGEIQNAADAAAWVGVWGSIGELSEQNSKTITFNIQRGIQCGLLRDIFCNPFRPVTLNPTRLTSTVLALANGIYEERAFDRMPILADALQDAGCDNEDVLNHCRGVNVHIRGCWVVDLLTGRT